MMRHPFYILQFELLKFCCDFYICIHKGYRCSFLVISLFYIKAHMNCWEMFLLILPGRGWVDIVSSKHALSTLLISSNVWQNSPVKPLEPSFLCWKEFNYEFGFFKRYRTIRVIYCLSEFWQFVSLKELINFTQLIKFWDTELFIVSLTII